MHESFTEALITARFTFRPERAAEFLAEPGRLVTQIECETLDEIIEYTHQFDDALENAVAIVNGRVVCLTGEVYDAETSEDIDEEV